MPQRAYLQMLRAVLNERQGGICPSCQQRLDDGRLMEVHHYDGDPANQAASNLALVHADCHERAGRPPRRISVRPVYVPTHTQGGLSFDQLEGEGYLDPDAPAPMRAGALSRPAAIDWLFRRLRERPALGVDDAIASAAFVTGKNVVTVQRWFRPLWSSEGPLERFFMNGTWHLQFKETEEHSDEVQP